MTAVPECNGTRLPFRRSDCEGIVSERLGSRLLRRTDARLVQVWNPSAPAVKREAEEDWGKERMMQVTPPAFGMHARG